METTVKKIVKKAKKEEKSPLKASLEKNKAQIEKKIASAPKPKEQILDKATADAAVKTTIEVRRELKYVYPKDCKTSEGRKQFRQKTRNALRKLEREIAGLEGKARTEKEKELSVYKDTVLA